MAPGPGAGWTGLPAALIGHTGSNGTPAFNDNNKEAVNALASDHLVDV